MFEHREWLLSFLEEERTLNLTVGTVKSLDRRLLLEVISTLG
jgi:hypothetical protein